MSFMKIGLISDIHGNKKALDAVLKQLEKEKIDKYGTKSSCSKRKSRKVYN